MKSHFEYHRPASVDEAVKMKCELGSDAYFWSGGTDLVLQWKHEAIKPLHCIDVTTLNELSYINDSDEALIRIGGLTTLADIERANSQHPHLKTLATVARLMCTVQTREIATIAGNLCNASPAGDLIPTLIAMGAFLKLAGPDGVRELAVENLMLSPGKTCLQLGEMVTEICIPRSAAQTASCYKRIDRTVVDIALVSAAAAINLDDNGAVESIRVAMGAVAPRVIRSPQAEAVLNGLTISDISDELIAQAGEAAAQDATPITDIRASAEYRKAMVKVLVRRVLKEIVTSLSGEK